MNQTVSLIFIISAIVLLIAALIIRLLKNKTIGSIVELVGIACFVVYTSKFAHWIIHMNNIDQEGIAQLALFVFSILLLIYRGLFLFVIPKR